VTARAASPVPGLTIDPGAAANFGLFVTMSLIWGATWAAVKVGVTAVPPVFFAGMRYALAGAVLAVLVRGIGGAFGSGFAGRTIVSGILINVGTYSLLFWGMQFVGSGVAGLINLSLIPVGLFGLSVLLGDERPRWRHAIALALGAAGLAVLFSGKASLAFASSELWGAAAIVAATLCYVLGTVLSRPLLAAFTPLQLTAAQAVVGAVGLFALAVACEPLSLATLRDLAAPAPFVGLLFLAIFGTVAAYTIYLRLVRDWGAPRAGFYAYVSPVVALTLGWLLFEEPLGWREAAGGAIMLIAAALATTGKPEPAPCDANAGVRPLSTPLQQARTATHPAGIRTLNRGRRRRRRPE
jgi:drug/metabolite transporter (DMT)-like permease